MDKMPQTPFESGWLSWELGEYRACKGTYCEYPVDSLPPLPDPDPTFEWLAPGDVAQEPSQEARAYWAKEHQKLEEMTKAARQLSIRLPDTFVRFMGTPELCNAINSGTGCWFHLGDRLVPCPGFEGAYLIGFLRDQQDCIVWCLCLLPEGGRCVLALGDDLLCALPEYTMLALEGDLEVLDEIPSDISPAPGDYCGTSEEVAAAVRNIRVCAPSFESFVYRFWLENSIAWKLGDLDKMPLTDLERRYLEHYARRGQGIDS